MAAHYDEVFGRPAGFRAFRPERQRVAEYLPNSEVVVALREARFPVHDVAMTGVSCIVPAGGERLPAVGETTDLTVLQNGEEVYRGEVELVRREPFRGAVRAAFRLISDIVEVNKLKDRDEEAALRGALEHGASRVRDLVPAGMRAVVEQAVHFVSYYRHVLSHHHKRYLDLHPDPDQKELLQLAHKAIAALRGPWAEIRREGSRVCMDLMMERGPALRAAKAYTEACLTPLLIDVPMVDRSYHKYLGYPGDYLLMLQLYANRPQGPNVFARVFHKLGCEEPLAQGVRERKELLKEILDAEYRRIATEGRTDEAMRVTSLACGAAVEVQELLSERASWPVPTEWLLIDPEENALEHAYAAIHRTIARGQVNARVSAVNLSFSQLMRHPSLAGLQGEQDVIYSAGLFDYLSDHRSAALIGALYQLLRPGGVLIIGNAEAPNEHFWMTEFITDWTLRYRTRDEMMALGTQLGGAALTVHTLDCRAYLFLAIRRP